MDLNRLCQYEHESKTDSIEWNSTRSNKEKKFLVKMSVKKVIDKEFWEFKEPLMINLHFLF